MNVFAMSNLPEVSRNYSSAKDETVNSVAWKPVSHVDQWSKNSLQRTGTKMLPLSQDNHRYYFGVADTDDDPPDED